MKNKKIIIAVIVSLLIASAIIISILSLSDKDTTSIDEITEISSESYEDVSEISTENTTLEIISHTIVSTTAEPETKAETTTKPVTTTSVTTTETTAATSYGAPADSITSLESEIVNVINEYRAGLGLYPLSLNTELSNFSAIRAKEASVSWSHTRPDGRKFHTVFEDYNMFTNTRVSEILAKVGAPDAERVVNCWNNSPSHHEVIVTTTYDEIGIAVFETDGRVYVAAHTI